MDVYDVMTAHLVAQKAKSMDWAGVSCKYRGREGMKCAVGCLIPDALFNTELEGTAISMGAPSSRDVINMIDPLYRDSPEFDVGTVQIFQKYHDSTAYVPGRSEQYSYTRWCDGGDKAHHPEKFLAAVREYIARQAVLAKGSD